MGLGVAGIADKVKDARYFKAFLRNVGVLTGRTSAQDATEAGGFRGEFNSDAADAGAFAAQPGGRDAETFSTSAKQNTDDGISRAGRAASWWNKHVTIKNMRFAKLGASGEGTDAVAATGAPAIRGAEIFARLKASIAGGDIPVIGPALKLWNRNGTNRAGTGTQTLASNDEPGAPGSPWSTDRIKVAQSLWGENYLEPGGMAAARKAFTRVMPNSKQSVLDLTIGLGGCAFTLIDDQNLWMEAREPDPVLAEKATQTAAMLGYTKKVPISILDMNDIGIPEGRYDLIYTRERLFAIEDKIKLLLAAAQGLKMGGRLLIADLMLADADVSDTDAIRSWMDIEPSPPCPWTSALYTEALKGFGLKIGFKVDFTGDYVADIYAGWHKVVEKLEQNEFDRALTDQLFAEGEIWLKRAQLLEAGDLVYCGIIAIRDD